MNNQPFSPTGATVAVAASTTTAQGTLTAAANQSNVLRVVNASTGIAFIRQTDTVSQAATSADVPMLGNTVELFCHVPGQRYVSVILSAGTGNVYLTLGEGM